MIGKFKMTAGDVISSRGQVMEYTYIMLYKINNGFSFLNRHIMLN